MYCINPEHSLKDKIVRLNHWGGAQRSQGEPKGHQGGSPKVLLFCINIGELDVIKDFFLDIFVRVCCKKNYFLLQ